jgi:hypothetical protein
MQPEFESHPRLFVHDTHRNEITSSTSSPASFETDWTSAVKEALLVAKLAVCGLGVVRGQFASDGEHHDQNTDHTKD